jgi:hypothetical protein
MLKLKKIIPRWKIKYKKVVETLKLLALGQSTILEQVSNKWQQFSIL